MFCSKSGVQNPALESPKLFALLFISITWTGMAEPGGGEGRGGTRPHQIFEDQLTLYHQGGRLCPPPRFSVLAPPVHRGLPHKKETVFIMTFMRLFSLGNNICGYSNNFGVSIDALSSILRLTILN